MPVNSLQSADLPNTCQPLPFATPHRLATVATLFGLTPPPLEQAKILELGCCEGDHLLGMAQLLPQATCVGVDLSSSAVAKAQATAKAVGLHKVSVHCLNLLEIEPDFGTFDYIIAHNLFSWVSPQVQEKLLELCHRHLTTNGIAYLSYHTQPGGLMRGALRELLQYYTASSPEFEQKQTQGKAILNALYYATQNTEDAYTRLLHEEITTLGKLPAHFVFQDWLSAPHYQPIYFHQFIDRARQHSLTYLGDAFLPTMLPGHFPDKVAQQLTLFQTDLIYQEQAMDLLRNRTTRHSLLVHQHSSLNRELSSNSLTAFYLASSLQTSAEHPTQYQHPFGSLTTQEPVVQAVLNHLAQHWPQPVAYSKLLEIAVAHAGPLSEDTLRILNNTLFIAYTKGLIEAYSHPLPMITDLTDCPRVSRLARWQARQGKARLTNLRCESVPITDQIVLELLPYLDGQHRQTDLIALLQTWFKAGKLTVEIQDHPASQVAELTDSQLQELGTNLLKTILHSLAQVGLLDA